MTDLSVSRRDLLASAGALLACGLSLEASGDEPAVSPKQGFRYCLNTSTIRGQQLPLDQQIEVAAKAGYDAIEPWMRDLADYEKNGNSLTDLGKRIADLGLTVESAIGFGQWIVDDDAARAKGLDDAKRDMELLQKVGGKRLAAPPTGATNQTDLNLFRAAERYRQLLDIGLSLGIVPQVEVWGFSKSLSRLGESVFVMIEAGHPQACLLPDVYHIYKGGSDFAGLSQLSASAIQVFHMNDYPAEPARDVIGDKDRVYPGDGVAPLNDILGMLIRNDCYCVLSLELFNPTYWQQDALTVARTGLEKMKASVASAEKALS